MQDQTNQHLQNINQDFKEKEVEQKAQAMNLPYVNLLGTKVSPDVLNIITEEESVRADLVVFFQIGKKIRIAVSEPENIHTKELIQRLKAEHFAVNINIASEESIRHVQSLYGTGDYKKPEQEKTLYIEEAEKQATEALEEFEKTTEKQLSKEKSSDALAHIHELAVQMRASDIHFQQEKEEVIIRFRIDGMLQKVSSIDLKTYDGIMKQVKFNAHLKLNINNAPQDGQYFFKVNERDIDIRVSILPTVYGESIVLRLLDPKKGVTSLSELGFRKHSLEKLATILSKPEGMILITGPTGAGKTSSLYSILDVLNRPHKKIITLEDPVEYKLPGVVQCEVGHEDGALSFQSGLVSALRQDPDIIMVGEIREPEVAQTAVQAAMTGHLVLSTLHTNSAIESFSRLQNLQIQEYLLAPSVNAIIAQRLVRRICSHCKTERDWKANQKEMIRKTADSLKARGLEVSVVPEKESFGSGCKYCNNTGYSGRIAITEILQVTEDIQNLVQEKASEKALLSKAVEEGFISMKEDAILKVLSAETTLEEVLRVMG